MEKEAVKIGFQALQKDKIYESVEDQGGIFMSDYNPDNIGGYLKSISTGNDSHLFEQEKAIFMNKNSLKNDLLMYNDKDLEIILTAFIKYNIIPDKDIKLMIKQIRNDDFIELIRTNQWYFTDIVIPDSDGKIYTYGSCKANFHLENKWGNSSTENQFIIIFDKKTNSVVWGDFGNKGIYNKITEEDVFISHNGYIYKIEYNQPTIYLSGIPKICNSRLENLDSDVLDKYINTVCREVINEGYGTIFYFEYEIDASIDSCIDKKFFKNGPKWKHGKRYIVYDGVTATRIKTIVNDKNTFKITMENNTYKSPLIRELYLDLEYLVIFTKENGKYAIFDNTPFNPVMGAFTWCNMLSMHWNMKKLYIKEKKDILQLDAEGIRSRILNDEYNENKILDGNYQTLIDYFSGEKRFMSTNYSEYIRKFNKNKSKKLFYVILDAFKIYNIDRGKEYEMLIDKLKYKIRRTAEWICEEIEFINLSEDNIKLFSWCTSFVCDNKLGILKYTLPERTVIIDGKGTIVWVFNTDEKPDYIIYTKTCLYGLSYNHTVAGENYLKIYNNKRFLKENSNKNKDIRYIEEKLDKLANKNYTLYNHEKKINLAEYFDMKFFTKGKKWEKMEVPMKITIIKKIKVTNGKMLIEIENTTYPISGYIYLDIKKGKITTNNTDDLRI